MHFNAFQCIAQPHTALHDCILYLPQYLWSRHFTRLCKSVHPWGRVSEIQSIKESKVLDLDQRVEAMCTWLQRTELLIGRILAAKEDLACLSPHCTQRCLNIVQRHVHSLPCVHAYITGGTILIVTTVCAWTMSLHWQAGWHICMSISSCTTAYNNATMTKHPIQTLNCPLRLQISCIDANDLCACMWGLTKEEEEEEEEEEEATTVVAMVEVGLLVRLRSLRRFWMLTTTSASLSTVSIIPMHVHILLGLIRTYARIVCLGLDRWRREQIRRFITSQYRRRCIDPTIIGVPI